MTPSAELYALMVRLAAVPPSHDARGQRVKLIRRFKTATGLGGRQWKKLVKASRRLARA